MRGEYDRADAGERAVVRDLAWRALRGLFVHEGEERAEKRTE